MQSKVTTLPWLQGSFLVRLVSRGIRILVSEQCDDAEKVGREIEQDLTTALEMYIPAVLERYDSIKYESGVSFPKTLGPMQVAWNIVELPEGGLGTDREASGPSWLLVPCRAYVSHAVLWHKREEEEISIVTARVFGKPWDARNDFLHEYLHAAVAPIPLYVQAWHRGEAQDDLSFMSYAIPEIVVSFLADEQRQNETGLPVLETYEALEKFLHLAARTLGDYGFESVRAYYDKCGLTAEMKRQLAASCMRALVLYKHILAAQRAPHEFFANRRA